MGLEEKVGQIFMPDFRQWDGKNPLQLPTGAPNS